jgi:hypothetical protein
LLTCAALPLPCDFSIPWLLDFVPPLPFQFREEVHRLAGKKEIFCGRYFLLEANTTSSV